MEAEAAAPWFGTVAVSFAHGGYPVLRGMDLAVAPGEIHALVGMHNSGKSTLCQTMAGLLAPDAGRVVAAGEPYPRLTPKKARELGIARVAGPPMIFSRMTVMENLVAGRAGWWLGLSPRRRYERLIRGWLERNNIDLPLDKTMRDLPREHWIAVDILSNLYREPRLLILDEVMEELGTAWQRPILAIIQQGVRRGMSVVWVTQKVEDALSAADGITVMRQGKAILTGRAGGMERLNLIRLCYAQLDGLDGGFADRESFHELMRYTEAMLNDIPSAVVVLDNRLRVRFVNRSGRKLFPDWTGDGESPFPSGIDERLRRLVTEAGGGESGDGAELLGVPLRLGGDGPLVDVRVQPIRENRVKVGAMVVVEDVSLRESLRRRVMLSDKLATVGLLAAGVAHEVNNPLEIIGNYLNYLDGEPLSPGGRKAVDKMEVEVGRIQQIIKNLVAYSGRKSGDSAVNPAELMRELVELLHVHMRPRNIDFSCDEPGGPLFLDVDPNELRQVFLNLIRNSLDAMPDHGGIAFRAARDGDGRMALLTIADTGTGIRLDNPNDIFLPFVTTKKDQGSHQGLGLYVVYGIIESYGGTIAAENLPAGGCRFSIRLPLAERQ